MWHNDEGRRPCWSSLGGMDSGWMAVTCLAHKDEAGGAQGQVPLRWLGARASTEWRGSTQRERPMSSHMAGGCPPRSAVASGPLKCELNFSAGSCAFGLFVTRRFGESERVSGPGATPPLAPSPVRIGSELSAAMPRSKEATSSKLFGCAAHGHKQAPAKEQQAASARAHRSATRSEQRAH